MKIGYCTIASAHYLPQVQILEDSLRKFHPESDFHILLCESPETCRMISARTGRNIVSPAEIGCTLWQHMAFCYDSAEFSSLLKPFLFETLLNQGYDALVYLDPDIEIYGRLEQLTSMLRDNNAVLTPHVCLVVPNDGKRPAMDDYIHAGHYDLGCIGISASSEVRELLRWWREVLVAHLSPMEGRPYLIEQRLAAAIPSFLEKTVTLRDPAYNMAYWNVFQRKLEYEEGVWMTDSGELKFFHFSGVCHQDLTSVSPYQNRVSAPVGSPLHRLVSAYCEKIPIQSWATFLGHPYSFAFYSNGEPVTLDERNIFLAMEMYEREEIGNPFDANNLPLNPIRVRCKEMLDRSSGRTDWIEQFKRNSLYELKNNAKLAAAIHKYRLAHRSVIGWFLRTWTNYYPNSVRFQMAELLSCDDKTFVKKSFLALLGRSPDPEGIEYYCKQLQRGVARPRILGGICRSPEYLSKKKL